MMGKTICSSMLLLAGAQASATTYAADFGFPQQFRGEWATSAAHCGAEGPAFMRINATRMAFHDAIGAMQSMTPDGSGADAITVKLDYVAQGKHWPETNSLTLAADGKSLTVSGHGKKRVYLRCPSINR